MYGIHDRHQKMKKKPTALIYKSSVLVNHTVSTANTDQLCWIAGRVSSGPSCLTCGPSTPPTTPSYVPYLLQRSQSEGRWVQLRRRRGGSWWNLASSWWRVCERKERNRGWEWEREREGERAQISSNSETDWKQEGFFWLHYSSLPHFRSLAL